MQAFTYANPKTREEASRLLSQGNSRSMALAGGTDLLDLMKDYVVSPRQLVNLKDIAEMRGIEHHQEGGLSMGALVTLSELMADPRIKSDYPALWEAIEGVRSPQIRNMGTIGGELCQHPRCWYFRNGHGLLAMHHGKSMVVEGDNRYHAILGNSGPAYFVNASTLAPALIALGARITLFAGTKEREMPLEQFFKVPSREGEREIRLSAGEILTHVHLPAANRHSASYEVRHKEALDWPLAAAAVSLKMSGKQVSAARVVMGHVAPVPWRSAEAEEVLAGKSLTPDVAEEAGKASVQSARALSMNAYKIRLARVAVKRAVLKAAGMEV